MSTVTTSPAIVKTDRSSRGDIHSISVNLDKRYCEYLPPGTNFPELRSLAVDQLNQAGFYKVANDIEECGHKFTVYQCEECGKRPATLFNCDQRLCPRCHYRQLLRFFRSHEKEWQDIGEITIVSFSYGKRPVKELAAALAGAKRLHELAVKGGLRPYSGVYYREPKVTDDGESVEIIYHYMLAEPHSNVLFMALRVCGVSHFGEQRTFGNYPAAYRYFIKHHCPFPISLLLREDLLRSYLHILRHQRLIQGFGSLVKVSGGRGKSKAEANRYACPFCGGKTHYYLRCSKDAVAWDPGAGTFYNP